MIDNDRTQPIQIEEEALDQVNGGLIGLLKVGEPEAQAANTYRGLTTVNQGTLNVAGPGGNGHIK